MSDKYFELNENTLSIIEEIGGHMPGGFLSTGRKSPKN